MTVHIAPSAYIRLLDERDQCREMLERADALLREFVRLACSSAVADEDWTAIVDETNKFLEQ